MITLDEFNQLDDYKKYWALTDGFYLEMRMENALHMMLYTLGSFYAEVYYDIVVNVVVKITGFKSNAILAKFIGL